MESIGTSSRVAPIAPSPLDFARGRNRCTAATTAATVATAATNTVARLVQVKTPKYIAIQSLRTSR